MVQGLSRGRQSVVSRFVFLCPLSPRLTFVSYTPAVVPALVKRTVSYGLFVPQSLPRLGCTVGAQ